MKKHTIITHNFNELSKEDQAEVLDNYRGINIDDDCWYEFIDEDFKEKLTLEGWEDIETSFDVNNCQGRGASFDAVLNIEKYLKVNRLKTEYPTISKYIKEDLTLSVYTVKNCYANHYSHEKTRYIDGCIDELENFVEDHPKLEAKIEHEFEKLLINIENVRYCRCTDFLNILDENFDHLQTDEAVKETLEANEYEFLNNKIY